MNWERIAAELHAYRQAQRRLWGDVDDMTLARFLAGTATDAERAAVDQAMQEHPAVRELVEGLRELAGEPPRERASEKSKGTMASIWRLVDGARELSEPLTARASETGGLTSAGMERHIATPSYTALSGDPSRPDAAVWKDIPLEPFTAALSVACRYLAPSSEWEVQLACKTAPDQPDFVGRGEVTITNEATGEIEIQLALRECLNQPIFLSDGRWRLTLSLEDHVWRAPLELRGGA
jgi:hypothetical protein